MANAVPRVFISHSHQDKQRFVIPFATALRTQGIDAWVDQWEMLPGDSIVDKIFEEGLKHAAAMVIVLSEHSIQSKWVREELNAGFVAGIEKGTRLIPILIDQVNVPEALKTKLWVNACSPEDFNVVVEKVVNAVFEHRQRPPLGPKPGFADIAPINGLQSSDTLVLKAFGDRTLTAKEASSIRNDEVWHDVELKGVSHNSYLEALEALTSQLYLCPSKILAPTPPSYTLSVHGTEQYLRYFYPNYSEAIRTVAADLVNNQPSNLTELLRNVQLPEIIVRHILQGFAADGAIRLTRTMESIFIDHIGRQLRRVLS